ncbi:hypothetical protein OC835_008091, partial [Tilletia horrida]
TARDGTASRLTGRLDEWPSSPRTGGPARRRRQPTRPRLHHLDSLSTDPSRS